MKKKIPKIKKSKRKKYMLYKICATDEKVVQM